MYLVAGGAGFTGSNLVHALVARGQRVRVLDNLATGRLDNLKEVLGSIDFVQGDILSLDACRKAMQGVRLVLHQGALPSAPRPGDVTHSLADINRAKSLLRYASSYDLPAGLTRTVEWFRGAGASGSSA